MQARTQVNLTHAIFMFGITVNFLVLGLFFQMLGPIIEEGGYLWEFVGVTLGTVLVNGVLWILTIKHGMVLKRTMLYGVNLVVTIYSILFIWKMPEVSGFFSDYIFETWTPTQIWGSTLGLNVFIGLNLTAWVWQWALFQNQYRGLLETVPTQGSNPEKPWYILFFATICLAFAVFGIIWGDLGAKFYFMVLYLWMLLEIMLCKEPSEIISIQSKSPNQGIHPTISWKQRLAWMWGVFFMLTVLLVVIPNQVNWDRDRIVLSLALPWLLLGGALSGLVYFCAKSLTNRAHVVAYWIAWSMFGGFWWLVLREGTTIHPMAVPGIQLIMGYLFGSLLILMWEIRWNSAPGRGLWFREGWHLFWMNLLLIVGFTVKIGLDHNTWDLFFYISVAAAGLALIGGIVGTIFGMKHK